MKKFLLATLLSVAALLSPAASSLTGLMAQSGEDSSLRVVSFNIRNGEGQFSCRESPGLQMRRSRARRRKA